MKKAFRINGIVHHFINIHPECGVNYGYCTEREKWAWLDPEGGIQFDGESRVIAEKVAPELPSFNIPAGCHVWGGEIRNNAAWRQRW